MLRNWLQQLHSWIQSNDLGDYVFMVLWLVVAALLALFLILSSGCATPSHMPPRIGSCLVDERDQWYCLDHNSEVTPKVGRYACVRLEEWADLMKYCKRIDQ